jgi:hypothetical protein
MGDPHAGRLARRFRALISPVIGASTALTRFKAVQHRSAVSAVSLGAAAFARGASPDLEIPTMKSAK